MKFATKSSKYYGERWENAVFWRIKTK